MFGCDAVNIVPLKPACAVIPPVEVIAAATNVDVFIVVATTLPATEPLNAPFINGALIVPAVSNVALSVVALIAPEGSRCTNVLAVALISCVLMPQAGDSIVLKFKPALIVLKPGKLHEKVSLLRIAYILPLNLNCITMWLALISLDELSAIRAGTAPVSPVAGVATGPTVIH